ncbi:biotin--[acetyl-CoA-carboxylase] ligase, partial [Salinimicrobium sp. CDJ15-91]|nr:biotin--[acetyl-CoA-carboxylase] ligase [Salinimicrobium oceani]
LRVKWPNDILSANQKIAGILIENTISEGKVVASVIGIGLNVNQTQFDDLPKAASMKTVSGRDFETEEVLELLLKDLENSFGNISEENSEAILKAYEKWL